MEAADLKSYMHQTLAATAGVLGWSVGAGSYDHAVSETADAAGVSDVAIATDVRRLKLLAQVEVWRAVLNETAADYDYDSGDTSLNRSQIFSQAKTMLALAQQSLLAYDRDVAAATSEAGQSYSIRARGVW